MSSSRILAGVAIAATASCANGAYSVNMVPQGDAAGGGAAGQDGFRGDLANSAQCTGLECQRVACDGDAITTIRGTVYAPTPIDPDPLYNAFVYIPNAPLEPFTPGVSCNRCGASVSGSPIVTALSGADGTFELKDVPVGTNIPIVVQLGRWRRKVFLPKVEPCVENLVPQGVLRLPRSKDDGEIPLHAVATGEVDGLECVLRKLGIDRSEFTAPSGSGRIHIYTQNGARSPTERVDASTLWGDVDSLKNYDIVLLPCEGAPEIKPVKATQNMIDYTSAGGRVLATHFGYVWIHDAPPPFPGTATWAVDKEPPPTPLPATVDMSFPKGADFAHWLVNVGASSRLGKISINQPRHDAVRAVPPSQAWITSSNPVTLQHYSFNTPLTAKPADQCGRVVYSDFHVLDFKSGPTVPFAAECDDRPLSAQEKVIEFMLFDLASCVQTDRDQPKPPPIR